MIATVLPHPQLELSEKEIAGSELPSTGALYRIANPVPFHTGITCNSLDAACISKAGKQVLAW